MEHLLSRIAYPNLLQPSSAGEMNAVLGPFVRRKPIHETHGRLSRKGCLDFCQSISLPQIQLKRTGKPNQHFRYITAYQWEKHQVKPSTNDTVGKNPVYRNSRRTFKCTSRGPNRPDLSMTTEHSRRAGGRNRVKITLHLSRIEICQLFDAGQQACMHVVCYTHSQSLYEISRKAATLLSIF